MQFYADIHIHSRFSRATSKRLDLECLSFWARLKGLQVIGTGDCVHPGWVAELKERLEPAEEGFFKLKPQYDKLSKKELPDSLRSPVRFVLTSEISNIYKRFDKVRRVHNVVVLPNFKALDILQNKLQKIGNIYADGRPILGLDSRNLLEIVLESDPFSYLVPAHIWTPWFSVLGSKGGFDSLEDCFGDLTKHIFALETGLSSDPPMNWRLSQLDKCALISNSDAHSPEKLGRESTIFDTDFSYMGIHKALSDSEDDGLKGTVEFFPEEGKYHYDGHRQCNMRMSPKDTILNKGLCPKCGKPVTIGVMNRVEELADNPEGRKSPRACPYYSLIPLVEIIAEVKKTGVNTKIVQQLYQDLIAKLGNEMFILREASFEEIKSVSGTLIAEGIKRMRSCEVSIAAGYDGEYGKINIFSSDEREKSKGQLTLF